MLDFSTLVAAQAPLPASTSVHLISAIQSEIEGRSTSSDIEGRQLPEFSASALKFISNLSPVLQKAALSALIKRTTSGNGNKANNFLSSISSAISSFRKPDRKSIQTPRTTLTTYTTTPRTTITISSTSPPTTTTQTTTDEIQAEESNQIPYVQAYTRHQEPTQDREPKTHHKFQWGNLESEEEQQEWGSTFGENPYEDNSLSVDRIGKASATLNAESGIVLLIGIFNLLAVVVYAAQRHVTDRPSLPPRVLNWQVQKVLDELVLRVHSSKGATQLLSSSMPLSSIPIDFTGRSIIHSNNNQQLLEAAKSLLIAIASSPVASSTAKLPGGMYRPLTTLYSTVSEDFQNYLSGNNSSRTFEGRSMNNKNSSPTWLQMAVEASKLSSIQWDGVLRTLTIIGQSRSLMSSQSITGALMKAILTPEGTARSFSLFDMQGLAKVAFDKMTQEKAQSPDSTAEEDKSNMRYENGSFDSRKMRRMGYVEDAGGMTGPGGAIGDHWSQRWFSLVTRLSPVALDATTLYARAHSSPKCLRSLLCSINFSWKKVGPLQAALTPLLSVLTGWALEGKAPHSLGESLEAIRAGWLGRDCSFLYPECDIRRSTDSMLQQALTYFSKLEISVKENKPLELETTPTDRTTFSTSMLQNRHQEIVTENSNVRFYDDHFPRNSQPSVDKSDNIHESSIDTEYKEPISHDSYLGDHRPLHSERENVVDPYSNHVQSRPDITVNHQHPVYDSDASLTNRIELYGPLKDTDNMLTSYELYRKEAYGISEPDFQIIEGDVTNHDEDKSYHDVTANNEVDFDQNTDESYPPVYHGRIPSRDMYRPNYHFGKERETTVEGRRTFDLERTGYREVENRHKKLEDEKMKIEQWEDNDRTTGFEDGQKQMERQWNEEDERKKSTMPYEKYDSPLFEETKDESLKYNQMIVSGMDLQDSPPLPPQQLTPSHMRVVMDKVTNEGHYLENEDTNYNIHQPLVSSHFNFDPSETQNQRHHQEHQELHYGSQNQENFIRNRDYQFTKHDAGSKGDLNREYQFANKDEQFNMLDSVRNEQSHPMIYDGQSKIDKEVQNNNKYQFEKSENTAHKRLEHENSKRNNENKFIKSENIDRIDNYDEENMNAKNVHANLNTGELTTVGHGNFKTIKFERIIPSKFLGHISTKRPDEKSEKINGDGHLQRMNKEIQTNKHDGKLSKREHGTMNIGIRFEGLSKGDTMNQEANKNDDKLNYIPLISKKENSATIPKEDKQSSFERELLQERENLPLDIQKENLGHDNDLYSANQKTMTSYPNDGYEVFKLLQKSNGLADVNEFDNDNSHSYQSTTLLKQKNTKSRVVSKPKPVLHMNQQELRIPKQRKQFWYHSAYPHLFKMNNGSKNRRLQKSSKTSTSFTKFVMPGNRRLNSRSKIRITNFPKRISITLPENTKEMKQHLALRHNKEFDESDTMPNNKKIHSGIRKNKNTKYKYGLRRGLPAVTVENFSEIEEDNRKIGKISIKLPPYFIYGNRWKGNTDIRHTNKRNSTLKNKRKISKNATKEPPKDVVEFGPDDAITDEYKNMLLYEYIRDQVRDTNVTV